MPSDQCAVYDNPQNISLSGMKGKFRKRKWPWEVLFGELMFASLHNCQEPST